MAVLKGIKKIAAYLDASETTVHKYIKLSNLPVRKINGLPNMPAISTTGLIDRWIEEEGWKNPKETETRAGLNK